MRLAGFEPTTLWFVARYSNPTELQPHHKLVIVGFIDLIFNPNTKRYQKYGMLEELVL